MGKTKAQLVAELEASRARIAALESRITRGAKPDVALLCNLVDQMLEPTVIMDWEGNLLHGNGLAAGIIGVANPDELVGLNIGGFVHPDCLEQAARDLEQVKNSEADFSANYKLLINDRTVHIESHGTKIELAGGSVDLVSFRDVTTRREAETRVWTRDEILRRILDNSTQVIFAKDLDGKYILINRRFEELFGVRNDAIIGKTDFDIFSAESAQKFQEKDREALRAARSVEDEEVVPHKDGSHTYFSVKFPLLDEDGQPFATCGIATDITERKQIERELHRAREALEDRVRERTAELLDEKAFNEKALLSLPGLFYVFGTDGRFLRWNKRFEEVSGYSQEEVALNKVTDFFSKEALPAATKAIDAVFEKGESSIEIDFMTKSGVGIPHLFTGVRVNIGDQVYCAGMGIDLSERVRAEAALKESEKKFRALADSTSAQIMISGQDRFLYANKAALNHMGYTWEQLSNMSPMDLFRGEGDPAECIAWAEEAARKGGGSFRQEYSDPGPDGKDRWFESNVSQVTLDGQRVWIATSFDVTALKEAQQELKANEERYRTIFNTAGTAMISFGTDSVITLANDEWAKLTGLTVEETLQNRKWSEFFTEESLAKMRQYHAMRSKDPSSVPQSYEAQIRDRFGVVHDGIINIQMVPGTQQRVASFQDLTELNRAQAEMYRADKMAALGQIIAGVAHEINNPNNFIYFNLPILKKYLESICPLLEHHLEDDPDLKILKMPYQDFIDDFYKLLENMEHGSKRITGIVSELKTYVRSDDELDTKEGEIGPVIESVMALVGKQVRKMVRKLDVSVAEVLPRVNMNPGKIEQVLINLLINAGQAANKNDSWVKLTAHAAKINGGEFVEILVEDNGAGIPQTDIDQVFEPFFTSKGREMGTGLGLSISQRIVEEHNGTINVESTVGEGTRFIVRLPAA